MGFTLYKTLSGERGRRQAGRGIADSSVNRNVSWRRGETAGKTPPNGMAKSERARRGIRLHLCALRQVNHDKTGKIVTGVSIGQGKWRKISTRGRNQRGL